MCCIVQPILRTGGLGVRRIMEACQKRGVPSPTWTVNGGFVVVTFMRPTKGIIQDGTQEDNLDKWIENQIRQNP